MQEVLGRPGRPARRRRSPTRTRGAAAWRCPLVFWSPPPAGRGGGCDPLAPGGRRLRRWFRSRSRSTAGSGWRSPGRCSGGGPGGARGAPRPGARWRWPCGGAGRGAVLWASPLGNLAEQRADNQHSNNRRGMLLTETVGSVSQGSPLVGFGSTRDVQGSFSSIAGGATPDCPACGVPPLGTQGHLWLVLFSQGWLGLAFFLLFVVLALIRSRPVSHDQRDDLHVRGGDLPDPAGDLRHPRPAADDRDDRDRAGGPRTDRHDPDSDRVGPDPRAATRGTHRRGPVSGRRGRGDRTRRGNAPGRRTPRGLRRGDARAGLPRHRGGAGQDGPATHQRHHPGHRGGAAALAAARSRRSAPTPASTQRRSARWSP